MNAIYYQILGLPTDADEQTLKKAYRKLIRENHPDIFPEDERDLQVLKTIQINEAYDRISKTLRQANRGEITPEDSETENQNSERTPGWDYDLHGHDPDLSRGMQVGEHKDPAYAYYKQGFNHYSSGLGGIKDMSRNRKLTNDKNGLDRSIYSLQKFHQAYEYFRRVVDEYPDSIWTRDAAIKLARIEGYNKIYRKIKKNIAERLAQADTSRKAHDAAPDASANADDAS